MGTAFMLFLRGIPLLVYPLVVMTGLWLYERHEVVEKDRDIVVLKAQDATAVIDTLTKNLAESNRRNTALSGEIDAAKTRAATFEASASAAGAAVAGLSGTLAAVKRRLVAAQHSTAASDVEATRQTALVCTGLLNQCEARSAERGRFADAANSAGLGCEHQYDSLKPATK